MSNFPAEGEILYAVYAFTSAYEEEDDGIDLHRYEIDRIFVELHGAQLYCAGYDNYHALLRVIIPYTSGTQLEPKIGIRSLAYQYNVSYEPEEEIYPQLPKNGTLLHVREQKN